jgi:hypothetical protein
MTNVIDLIQLKRGSSGNVAAASLEKGEPAVSLDTKELWVGDGTGKIKISDTLFYNTYSNLPATGQPNKLYIIKDTAGSYIWDTNTNQYKKYELAGESAVVHCRVRMVTNTTFPSSWQDILYPIKDSETEPTKLSHDGSNQDRIIFHQAGYYRVVYNIVFDIPPVGGTMSDVDCTVSSRINKNDTISFPASQDENIFKMYYVNEGLADNLTNEVVEYFDSGDWVSVQVMAAGDPAYIRYSDLEVYKVDAIKGDSGTPGSPGSIWYNGTGVPSVGIGNNNDYYLDTSNGNVYQKLSDIWTFVGNIRGAIGPAGDISLINLVSARRTTNYSIPTTWTDVTLDISDAETDPTVLKRDTANTDRIVVLEDGWYDIDYYFQAIVATTMTNVYSRVRVNDTTIIPASVLLGKFYQTEIQDLKASFPYYLNAGDFISVQIMRDATSTVILQPNLCLIVKKLQGVKGLPGDPGDTGPQGEKGEAFQVDEYDNLDEARIASIESGSGASPTNLFYFLVLDDNRTNQTLPPPLNGDMSRHVIMYDGIVWYDFGPFTGIEGPQGPPGEDGQDGAPGGLFEMFNAASPTEQQTTNDVFQQKVRLSAVGLTGGTYRIGWYYEWRYNSGVRDFRAQVQVDDTTILMDHQQEPKDTGDDQNHPASGFAYISLSSGDHNIDLDWCCSNAGDTATIRRARLELWKM